MKKILVVVDMQNDFIDGALGTPEAVNIVDNVVEKIRGTGLDDNILVTMDSHDRAYLESNEGKYLPVEHCVYGTDGWRLNPKIVDALKETASVYDPKPPYTIRTKDSFACRSLIDDVFNLGFHHVNVELTLVGVCTDICVISNALLLKAHLPEMRIIVDASCCAGSSPEMHQAALRVMESCQIDIVNWVRS